MNEKEELISGKESDQPMAIVSPEQAFAPARLSEESLAIAQDNIRLLQELKLIAISGTNPDDWLIISGKPYPLDSASMKMALLFGISFTDIKWTPINYSDDRGPVMGFEVILKATFRGTTVEADGSAYSNDQFFNGRANCSCTRKKDCPLCHGTGSYVRRLPLSEIPIGNVRKKAVTNAKGRGFRSILGIKFTKDDVYNGLKKGGKNPQEVKGFDFHTASKTSDSIKPIEKEKEEIKEEISEPINIEDLRHRIQDFVETFSKGDPTAVPGIIEYFTAFTVQKGPDTGKEVPGVDSVQKISDKQVPIVYRRMTEIAKQKGYIK